MPSRAEYTIPLLAALSFTAASAISSSRRYFWTDEIFSHAFVSDPSFAHMMSAFAGPLNATPPVYFALGWGWVQFFGDAEVSLRLFSSLWISVAFAVLWWVLRRAYGVWAATLGLGLVFCLSALYRNHNSDARYNTLLLAEVAVAISLYCRIAASEASRRGLLVANAVVHAAIVMTTYLGFFFSGAILLAFLLLDGVERTFRPRRSLSVLVGWLAFVPWIGVFLEQSKLSRAAHYWLAPPALKDLLETYDLNITFFGLFVVLTLGSLFLLERLRGDAVPPAGADASGSGDADLALLLVAATLLTVPVGVWIFSRLFTPIFLERYLFAVGIAVAIFWARLLHRFLPSPSAGERGGARPGYDLARVALPAALVAVLLAFPVFAAMRIPVEERPGSRDALLGYESLPIAVESEHVFLTHAYYSPRPERYVFILDWEVALQPASQLGAPNEFQNMETLARFYPRTNAMQSEDFLAKYDEFLVLESPDILWAELRLKNDPRYLCTSLNIPGLQALHVKRLND